jgi:hypothetical protein
VRFGAKADLNQLIRSRYTVVSIWKFPEAGQILRYSVTAGRAARAKSHSSQRLWPPRLRIIYFFRYRAGDNSPDYEGFSIHYQRPMT